MTILHAAVLEKLQNISLPPVFSRAAPLTTASRGNLPLYRRCAARMDANEVRALQDWSSPQPADYSGVAMWSVSAEQSRIPVQIDLPH